MALLGIIMCKACSLEKEVMYSPSQGKPTICSQCKKAKEEKAKQEYLDKLATLPIEQRIRAIEEWIYDYKPPIHWSDIRF